MHGSDEEEPREDDTVFETQKLKTEPENIELKSVEIEQKEQRKYPLQVIGEKKPFFKTSHLRFALLSFNCILAILGLLILIVAVWVRVDPEFWQYDSNLDISAFYTVCNLFIVAGLILVLVAFLGCVGVVMESQGILIAHSVIFAIIFLMELAAVILVWSAPYSSTIRKSLERQIKKQVDRSPADDASRYFLDFVQQNLECCGAVGQTDYPSEVPKSCRSETTGNVNPEGCAASMLRYLRAKAGLIGGIGIPILLFQLLAKFVSFCLIYNIRNESRYKMRD